MDRQLADKQTIVCDATGRITSIHQSLPECAPLYILSTEAHMDSFFQQRAEGHVLAESPVTNSLTHHVGSSLQDTTDACGVVGPNKNRKGYQSQLSLRMFRTTWGWRSPPWAEKSGTGTEAATFPMWLSSSSLMPVDGQLIVLGWPSRVKKPKYSDRTRSIYFTTDVLFIMQWKMPKYTEVSWK